MAMTGRRLFTEIELVTWTAISAETWMRIALKLNACQVTSCNASRRC